MSIATPLPSLLLQVLIEVDRCACREAAAYAAALEHGRRVDK